MSDVLKTYDMSGPPSIALARMAARLAMQREYDGRYGIEYMHGGGAETKFAPTPRRYCVGRAGREYYRIIDRLSAGEAP